MAIHDIRQALHDLESGISLDAVIWIQQHGNAISDVVAHSLNIIGHPVTSALLISRAFWNVDRRVVWRTAGALHLALFAVMSAKQLLKTARPYVAHPNRVDAMLVLNSYGIPSGHTVGALIVVKILAEWFKKRWVWLGGGFYVLLIAWSRMYLGVHYPHDELAGAMLAPIVWWAWCCIEQQVTNRHAAAQAWRN